MVPFFQILGGAPTMPHTPLSATAWMAWRKAFGSSSISSITTGPERQTIHGRHRLLGRRRRGECERRLNLRTAHMRRKGAPAMLPLRRRCVSKRVRWPMERVVAPSELGARALAIGYGAAETVAAVHAANR